VIRGLINNRKVIANYEYVLEELEREKLRNKELKEKIALTEDPEYMEVLARKKLGLVKNDEIVYKIVNK
jgi:cell division protein FtsB